MKTTSKLNNIQVLRAFAAGAVVLFHTGFAFPGLRSFGSFGVDVFFVISGYIMARILDPRTPSSGDFFLRRRILRIVPPYWFFTLLLFIAALKVPQLMGATRATSTELLKSLLFIPFIKGSGVIQPLLFLGWSLNYEMFFYVALAIGVLIHRRSAVWIGGAIVLLTMLGSILFGGTNVLAMFYGRDIILEFLLGILSYYVCRAISDEMARRIRIPALLVCVLCGLGVIAVQGILPSSLLSGFGSRVASLGMMSFFLVTSAALLSQGGWDTRLKWLVVLGDASYILYLVHPYCEYCVDRILVRISTGSRGIPPIGALVGISIAVLVGVALHLKCERPLVRYLNSHFGGKRKSAEFQTMS